MAKARVRQLTNSRSRSDGPSDLVYTGPTMALLSENADIGTLVLVASVETKGEELVSYRLGDGSANVFEIDSVSGELRTTGAIDRESLALTGSLSVSLRIETSSGTFLEVPVTVIVLDVNDEAPKFNQNEYFSLVHENLAPFSPLGGLGIDVSDPDSVIIAFNIFILLKLMKYHRTGMPCSSSSSLTRLAFSVSNRNQESVLPTLGSGYQTAL